MNTETYGCAYFWTRKLMAALIYYETQLYHRWAVICRWRGLHVRRGNLPISFLISVSLSPGLLNSLSSQQKASSVGGCSGMEAVGETRRELSRGRNGRNGLVIPRLSMRGGRGVASWRARSCPPAHKTHQPFFSLLFAIFFLFFFLFFILAFFSFFWFFFFFFLITFLKTLAHVFLF